MQDNTNSQHHVFKWIFRGNLNAHCIQLIPRKRLLTARVTVVHRHILYTPLFVLDICLPGCSHHQVDDDVHRNHVGSKVRVAIQGAEDSVTRSNNNA
jgi:hypothetical protein